MPPGTCQTGSSGPGAVDIGSPSHPETLELRPGRLRAAGWSLVGMALVTMGAWIVADSHVYPVAVGALTLFVLVAFFFLLQLFVPALFRVRLAPDRVEARVLWRRVVLPWDAVRTARVTRRLGDFWLVLDVRVSQPASGGPAGGAGSRRVGILLPVGADVDRLRDWLEDRFGPRV